MRAGAVFVWTTTALVTGACASFPDYPEGSLGGSGGATNASGAGGSSTTSGGSGGSGGGIVLPPAPAEVTAWLGDHKGGYCSNAYVQRINVCNGSFFCMVEPPMGPYLDGLSLDIGFDWPGTDTGNLIAAGSSGFPGLLEVTVHKDHTITANGPNDGDTLKGPIAPGRHLVSYYVSSTARALYVDGVAVAMGSSSGTASLGIVQGPGFTLGARNSEQGPSSADAWLEFAPFFFHLRHSSSPSTWTLDGATKAQAKSTILLEPSGVSGSTWKNSVALTPKLDAEAMPSATSAPLVWVDDVANKCSF